ncbi:hypothetical protein BD289DRAFT_191275 [Coniella lustricola]|uniref:Uncharacterized protein n=1 Tax=Coniella lustricola TaxID=2025994 RepID=A0A2T2ZSU6_9PEZI|nr:hypothetical protein BD289DRAFT_191275 [Coniella lustricola]
MVNCLIGWLVGWLVGTEQERERGYQQQQQHPQQEQQQNTATQTKRETGKRKKGKKKKITQKQKHTLGNCPVHIHRHAVAVMQRVPDEAHVGEPRLQALDGALGLDEVEDGAEDDVFMGLSWTAGGGGGDAVVAVVVEMGQAAVVMAVAVDLGRCAVYLVVLEEHVEPFFFFVVVAVVMTDRLAVRVVRESIKGNGSGLLLAQHWVCRQREAGEASYIFSILGPSSTSQPAPTATATATPASPFLNSFRSSSRVAFDPPGSLLHRRRRQAISCHVHIRRARFQSTLQSHSSAQTVAPSPFTWQESTTTMRRIALLPAHIHTYIHTYIHVCRPGYFPIIYPAEPHARTSQPQTNQQIQCYKRKEKKNQNSSGSGNPR